MRSLKSLRSNAQWIDEVLQEFEIQCSMYTLAEGSPRTEEKKRFPMSPLFYIREESYYSRFMESQCYNGYTSVTASVFIAVGLELTAAIGDFNIRFQCKKTLTCNQSKLYKMLEVLICTERIIGVHEL